MNPELMKNMVDYIEKTSGLLNDVAMQKQAAAQRVPEVVDVLIKRGFLERKDRERAINALQDPLKALESLKKTAESTFTPPPALGAPVVEKKASGRASNVSEADRAFMSQIGLAWLNPSGLGQTKR